MKKYNTLVNENEKKLDHRVLIFKSV